MTIRRRIPVKLPLFLWVLSSWLDPAPSLAQPPDPPAGNGVGAGVERRVRRRRRGYDQVGVQARTPPRPAPRAAAWTSTGDTTPTTSASRTAISSLTNTRTRVDASTWGGTRGRGGQPRNLRADLRLLRSPHKDRAGCERRPYGVLAAELRPRQQRQQRRRRRRGRRRRNRHHWSPPTRTTSSTMPSTGTGTTPPTRP